MARKQAVHSSGDSLIQRGYMLALLSVLILLFGIYTSLLSPVFAHFGLSPVGPSQLSISSLSRFDTWSSS